MNKQTFALAVLILVASTARADDWSAADTTRQAALTTLFIADWAQTRWMVKHPRSEQTCTATTCSYDYLRESNPLLGSRPSIGKVNNLVAASIVGHAAIAYMLPAGEWRKGWQYVFIGIETGAVLHNRNIGLKMAF